MNRPVRYLLWSLLLLLVLTAALAAFVLTLDLDRYRSELQDLLSQSLGREVSIRGDLTFTPALPPALLARDVSIANPAWASRPEFVHGDRVSVRLALLPLLKGDIVLPLIEVEGADVLLEEDPHGAPNWRFDTPGDGGGHFRFGGIGTIRVKASTAGYRTGAGTVTTIRLDEGEMPWVPDRDLHLTAVGSYLGSPFRLEARGDTPNRLLDNIPEGFPLKARLGIADTSVEVDGILALPLSGAFDLKFAIRGTDLHDLHAVAPKLAPPGSGAYKLEGQFSYDGEALRIRDTRGSVEATERTRSIIFESFLPHSGAIVIDSLSATLGSSSPTSIELTGSLDGEPTFQKLSGAPFAMLLEETGRYHFELETRYAQTQLKLKGELLLPVEKLDYVMDVDLRVGSATGWTLMLPQGFEHIIPFTYRAHLESGRDRLDITNLHLKSAGSTITGEMGWGFRDLTPRLNMDLAIDTLDISQFTPDSKKVDDPLQAQLALNWLEDLEGDAALKIGRIRGLGAPVRNVRARAKLRDSRLRLQSLRLSVAGTALKADGNIGKHRGEARVSLSVRADRVDLDTLKSGLGLDTPVSGNLNDVAMRYSGNGKTPGELLRRGDLALTSGRSRIVLPGLAKSGPLVVIGKRLSATAASGKPLAIEYTGRVDGMDLRIGGTLGTMGDWLSDAATIPFRQTATINGVTLESRGDISVPWDGTVVATYRMKASQLADLSRLLQLNLPPVGPLALQGNVQLNGDRLRLGDLHGQLGGAGILADLKLDQGSSIPIVSGKVEISQLDPTVFVASAPVVDSGAQAPARFIPDITLPVEALRSANLGMEVTLRDLQWQGRQIGTFDLPVSLQNGDLSIAPVEGRMHGGGDLLAELDYKTSRTPAEARLVASLNRFNYSQYLVPGENPDGSPGLMDVALDLSATGTTTRSLLAATNGQIEVLGGPANVSTHRLRLTLNFKNLISAMIPEFGKIEGRGRIECFVARWEISDGIAHSDALLLNGSHYVIAASGAVDLETEIMDLFVQPEVRDHTLLDVATPVRVTGPVKDPRFEVGALPSIRFLNLPTLNFADPVSLIENIMKLPSELKGGTSTPSSGAATCIAAIDARDARLKRGEERRRLWKRFKSNLRDLLPER